MSGLLLCSSTTSIFFLIFALLLRFRRRRFIDILPGPPSSSWLVGNIPDFVRIESAGDTEFEWVEKYGTIFKFKGTFGADVLHITDPKALQYILGSGYNFHKPKTDLEIMAMFSSKGLIAVEGPTHSRHRKIMNPAFAYPSLKEFLPIFSYHAQRASNQLRDMITEAGKDSEVIDVSEWLPRLALDVIGEAALDYRFGALDREDNELSNAYRNIFSDVLYHPSDADIIFRGIWGYLPAWILRVLPLIPLSGMKRIRNYTKVSFRVAKRLVEQKMAAISDGNPPKHDAMSLLVRANSGENPKGKVSDDEILSEMSTLMLTGHETISSTTSWFLYELSRRPEAQQTIREESTAARDRASARGDYNLTITDLESMTYTVAALKETLRLHSIATFLSRVAGRDDAIPLSKPHRSVTGEMFTSVPVRKGQKFRLSVASYNRLKDVWGNDAHEWRPERFTESHLLTEQKTSVGVYANLASFGGGVHSCIGWRFATLEIQSILIELVNNFTFTPPPGNIKIIRAPIMILTPMVRGQTERGTQLPLQVTPL